MSQTRFNCSSSTTSRNDSESYNAHAVRLLREVAPLTDYTDRRAERLLEQLLGVVGAARRTRGTIPLVDIGDIIAEAVVPATISSPVMGYVRTELGYVVDPTEEKLFRQDFRLVSKARQRVMTRYRTATRRHRWMAFIRGPVRCVACGGPLMANGYGWTERGIACSHCGFSPFVSIFFACECGAPILLVAQPPIRRADLLLELRRGLTGRCDQCGAEPRAERIETRSFQLNIPWPPEKFSDQVLIDARERVGLTGPGGIGVDELIKNHRLD